MGIDLNSLIEQRAYYAKREKFLKKHQAWRKHPPFITKPTRAQRDAYMEARRG